MVEITVIFPPLNGLGHLGIVLSVIRRIEQRTGIPLFYRTTLEEMAKQIHIAHLAHRLRQVGIGG